jgi:dTDP-glucose pyrophosphorylase
LSLNKIKSTVHIESTIRETLEVIEATHMRLACVTQNGIYCGVITDGDIRRSILDGDSLDKTIEHLYTKNAITASVDQNKNDILKLFLESSITYIPLIDNNKKLIKILSIYEFLEEKKISTTVVIMAGGQGIRMLPLTKKTPKPMLDLDGKPILETIINKFSDQGFVNFVISTNYKSNKIIDYFGDGSKINVSISYTKEEKRMGTAGSLLLDTSSLSENFLVINGDVVTNINFRKLMKFHSEKQSNFTIVTKKYKSTIPFGVIESKDGEFNNIVEKPSFNYEIAAGIYAININSINVIPENQYYDMPDFIKDLSMQNKKISVFPIKEYWSDIGTIKDLKKVGE